MVEPVDVIFYSFYFSYKAAQGCKLQLWVNITACATTILIQVTEA
jgi:hypothetical protein